MEIFLCCIAIKHLSNVIGVLPIKCFMRFYEEIPPLLQCMAFSCNYTNSDFDSESLSLSAPAFSMMAFNQ